MYWQLEVVCLEFVMDWTMVLVYLLVGMLVYLPNLSVDLLHGRFEVQVQHEGLDPS